MLTDAPPRKANRARFLESDRLTTLRLPENSNLVEIARCIEAAMVDGNGPRVRTACSDLLTEMASFYAVPPCGIRVLAARPLRVRERWTSELFGDYTPDTKMIRVWMRTAVRKEVTSFGTFLSTLCHEFCHHLDFRDSDSPIPGTPEGSMKGLARSTTVLVERRRSVCSGRPWPVSAGVSIGRAPIAESKIRSCVGSICVQFDGR
jgi:hypothetical protein